ncbi:MAG: hypothetical protein GTN67_05165 [Hydrotalea flava]|uniref:CBU_0592 family membrane protein n=1 Tax=Hydrotalea TaxID=1004300 RepID=UPI000943F127|nr:MULTISPECIES: hypothetical protein [Hydrotalea]MBY0347016.1 hypothetical protein [Hydrotalea flava]NIM34832.1 hypothetical protein [Hydrotalea flava]NIM37659.1 hypothetical protein [Hydrotalea flava]NIN02828.1 hypothetical protein [Hydrotalea flava]NIN14513.1 hypothetical protein [Hydrotalea flava]
MQILIEVIGWLGALLLLGSYYMNMNGKLAAASPLYIWSNIVGGICFIINSSYHHAFPSVMVNIIWIGIAIVALIKAQQQKRGTVGK